MARSFAQGHTENEEKVATMVRYIGDHGTSMVYMDNTPQFNHGRAAHEKGAWGHNMPVPKTRSSEDNLLIGPLNTVDLSRLPEREICFRAGIPSVERLAPSSRHVQIEQRLCGEDPETRDRHDHLR